VGQDAFDDFVKQKSEENVNFLLWWSYMEMVSILLMFTNAQRNGCWGLYMHSFSLMMPYFFRYDHFNYARWRSVFITEMDQLPTEVLNEFNSGNFVVKWNVCKLNQVSPDHSLEWLNGIGKRGGIVDIMNTPSALSRWALSCNLHSQIDKAHKMFGLSHEDKFSHNESTPARKHRNNVDESSLCVMFEEYRVFSPTADPDCLYTIATKDLISEEIRVSLLNAQDLGHQQMSEFVEQRLQSVPDSQQPQEAASLKVEFYNTIHKNNAPTFDHLYQIVKAKEKEKSTILQVDKNVLHCLIVAYEAGRSVDLKIIVAGGGFLDEIMLAHTMH
jgi:hypothetical protein